MTATTTAAPSGSVDTELPAWLEDNWDPDLTLEQWWDRLGTAGWSLPILPPEAYGKGLTRGDAVRAATILSEAGVVGAPNGLGLSLAAPTIATRGTPEQVERYVRDIVTGQRAWCQLFSEPGAGSDLAGLATRAERDGDEWIVNGQKVWTSLGHFAELGMLLARTDPTAPKHRGITWFVIDMAQPGVEVRPLKEMTGRTMFSEVFFTDAVVHDADRIGELNDGWSVANTTLAFERSGMGAGGPGAGASVVRPGHLAGELGHRVGDLAPKRRRRATSSSAASTPAAVKRSPAQFHIDLARDAGLDTDPVVRQQLARAHTLGEIRRMTTERHKAVRAAGGDIPGVANFSKLLMADILRLNRDLGLQLLGPRGTLHGYDADQRQSLEAAGLEGPATQVTAEALSAQALPIYGGTDQIQRNIIGERVLGLPKEPGDLSRLPFNELPRNG